VSTVYTIASLVLLIVVSDILSTMCVIVAGVLSDVLVFVAVFLSVVRAALAVFAVQRHPRLLDKRCYCQGRTVRIEKCMQVRFAIFSVNYYQLFQVNAMHLPSLFA